MTAVTTLTALRSSDGRIYTKYSQGDKLFCVSTHLNDTFWEPSFLTPNATFVNNTWLSSDLDEGLRLQPINGWELGFRPSRINITLSANSDIAGEFDRYSLIVNTPTSLASMDINFSGDFGVGMFPPEVFSMSLEGLDNDIDYIRFNRPSPGSFNSQQETISCIQFVE